MSDPVSARRSLRLWTVLPLFWVICTASVSAEQVLRFSEFGPNRGTRALVQDWFTDELYQRSQGQLILRTTYGGSLISAKNTLRGVAAGVADLGAIVAAYTPAQFERYRVADLPVGDDDPWVGLRENIRGGWATCPITQNGCLRIMAQPGYPNQLPTSLVAHRLREATQTVHHQFWSDDNSLLDTAVVDWNQLIGARQLTDIYLLALAAARGGRFVTFDTRIPISVVPGANEQSLCVV